MRENSNDNGNRETVYIIFRVLNLGTDNTGLRILVDPEKPEAPKPAPFHSRSVGCQRGGTNSWMTSYLGLSSGRLQIG